MRIFCNGSLTTLAAIRSYKHLYFLYQAKTYPEKCHLGDLVISTSVIKMQVLAEITLFANTIVGKSTVKCAKGPVFAALEAICIG